MFCIRKPMFLIQMVQLSRVMVRLSDNMKTASNFTGHASTYTSGQFDLRRSHDCNDHPVTLGLPVRESLPAICENLVFIALYTRRRSFIQRW